MFTSVLHPEGTLNTSHNFSTYYWSTFIFFAMGNPCKILIFNRVLKPDKLEGHFKWKNLGILFQYQMRFV